MQGGRFICVGEAGWDVDAVTGIWGERARKARLGVAALAGACGALSQAPYDLAPFILLMLAVGFWAWDQSAGPRGAFVTGWMLGAAYFALSLRWIVEPFQVDAATYGWMAPFALALLAGGLGLFWGAAFALARWLGSGVALIVAWTGSEFVRAYVFTGFPWANPAQALLDTGLAAGLGVVGPHGLTFVLVALASLVLLSGVLFRGLLICAALALAVPVSPPEPEMRDVIVRLVQPNAPQHQKWDRDLAHGFVERQLQFTATAPEGAQPALVVWPETAIPYLSSVAQPVFDWAHEAAEGAPVLMGVQRDDPRGRVHNSAVLIGPEGRPSAHYDKHHLVPFGEYMPLPALFRSIGVRALAERTELGYTPGPGPEVLDLGEVGQALILICYEAVFPQNMRAEMRPDFVVQVTNDAWFGQSIGPQQHLALARMRAIEQGLPLARVANTGITAMIGPRGALLDQLPLNQAGFLDARLPAPVPPTVYAQTGDMPLGLILLAAFVLLTTRRLRH